ncbi:MAG: hypothetical protein AAFN78_03845 [Pseudomonadota bacterium]
MTDKIFLLHGMGHHPEGWQAEADAKLRELYGRYGRLSRRGFDDRFELVAIEYDDVFRRLVSDWQEDAEALGPISDAMGADLVSSLIGWLRNAGELEDNFIWTHAADVLLYRFFASVRHEVKTKVAARIAEEITALPATSRWSVIAHSLGCAVAHDALDMLWTGKKEDGTPTGFEPRHEQALLIAMVANVSRVLQTNPKAYDSTVKPGGAGEAGRGCLNYLTCRHVLDPFCIPKMFRPLDWPDADAEERGLYHYVEVDHIHQANIHDLPHYLEHPAVHIPLFRELTFRSAVTSDEEHDALAAFPKFGNLAQSDAIDIKQRLEDMAPGITTAWTQYRAIWDKFSAIVGQ